MNWLPDHYKVPLFIVENGFGAYDTLEENGSIYDPYRLPRRKKDSFEWYKEVISTNGENINQLTR